MSHNKQRYLELMSKLQAMLACNNAIIDANPRPFLKECYREMSELLEVLDNVEQALTASAADMFVYDPNEVPRLDPLTEIIGRNQEATKILSDYRNRK